jgi:FkbM family methyltransferase
MRRIKILIFWLLGHKNNVGFIELMQFFVKPTIHKTAKKYVKSIEEHADDVVFQFRPFPHKLYWPKSFFIGRFDQIISETFDKNDWHYYQKKHTEIEDGEILLEIGAAEGLFPLTVIEKCEHLYLVEPSQTFYNCLKKTYANFRDKTTIINSAIGNFNGIISFDDNSFDGAVTENADEKSQEIQINKIDNLFKNNEKISYLKADIEGFEQEMLRGAEQTIKKNRPKIAITTYHAQNDPKEIISIIKGYVPEYNYYVKGIHEQEPKPVMIHFWI